MAARTPGQIQRFLEDNQHRFDLSVQFLGDEPNATRKPWDTTTVRWLLTASWPYEAAAGNQSIPAVYQSINRAAPNYLCDRFYLPSTPRDLKLLERHGIPVFGIESKHQLRDFDVVGTSISYSVLSMSFAKLLTMSDVPLRWRDREDRIGEYPMVMCGGLSYGAPEMLAPVVDCWWLGEVEDEPGNPGVGVVTRRIDRFKTAGLWVSDRLACYEALAREFPFLYFPRFVDVQYDVEDRSHVGVGPHLSKQVVGYSGNLEGMRLPFLKRHVRDLDAIDPLDDPPLLYADPAMGSGDLEVGRGCPAWCSFCALTYRQKPYRQRSVPYMVQYGKTFQDNMGSTRMAPFSPDFPMHTQRKALVGALLEQVSDEVDAPTMRVDDFIADNEFILLQVHGGMDTVTLGVEGNSQRMRDLIGKGTSDEDIREAVTRGIRAGIRKFKLYMISNLPGEDEGDIMRILHLAKDLADIREAMRQPTVQIQLSWTPLIIEANTPMQWFAATPQSRFLGDIWDELRDMKILFKLGAKAEPNRFTFFQLCQRASREVGEALVDAMEEVGQACWGGVPRTFAATLDTHLKAHGFANGVEDCFDERDRRDMFGWEFISQGVSSELMWKTYVQMREFAELTESDTYDKHFDAGYHGNEWTARCDERCSGKSCGACSLDDLKIRTGYLRAGLADRSTDLAALTPVDQRTQAIRIRARILKPATHRFVGNDHYRFAVRRAAFRAQRQLGTEYGIAKRTIRFASDEIRHRDWSHGADYVEFALTRRIGETDILNFLAVMQDELAPWLDLTCDWAVYHADAPTMRTNVDLTLYELEIPETREAAAAHLRHWASSAEIPMRLKVDGGYFAPNTEDVNAKAFTDDLWLVARGHRVFLRMLIRGRPTPYDIYAALTGRPAGQDIARHPATRLEAFVESDRTQGDFFRPNCQTCGLQIPTNVLDQPYSTTHCPRCYDTFASVVIADGRTTMTEPTAPQPDQQPTDQTDTTGDTTGDAGDPSNTPIEQLVADTDEGDDGPQILRSAYPDGPTETDQQQ